MALSIAPSNALEAIGSGILSTPGLRENDDAALCMVGSTRGKDPQVSVR